jgi:membrane-bound inhibitor of C-type lysozyme
MSKTLGLLLSMLLSSCFTVYAADDLPTVYFNCGKTKIWADFHDKDQLDLTMGRITYVMHSVVSGSGARYETPNGGKPHVVFWNKGKEATLTIDDKTYPTCHQTK